MIYSYPTKAVCSTVLHDCRRGDMRTRDDGYDHV